MKRLRGVPPRRFCRRSTPWGWLRESARPRLVRHERGRSRYLERRRTRGGGVLRGDVHCRRPYTPQKSRFVGALSRFLRSPASSEVFHCETGQARESVLAVICAGRLLVAGRNRKLSKRRDP